MMPRTPDHLGEQVSTLRHALRGVQHQPAPDPVHDLRSTIRRIQAALQSDVNHRARFLKATKPIRRASGLLRDLDIQLALLANLAQTHNLSADNGHEIQRLTRQLRKQREPLAERLQRQLGKHRPELRDVLDTLAGLQPAPVPEPGRLASTLFNEAIAVLDPRDPLQLHAIRKAARISRYLAETASVSSSTARHFHHIHQAIGAWHDWLTLTETAREHLSPDSPLHDLLERHQSRARSAAIQAISPPAQAIGPLAQGISRTGSMESHPARARSA